MPSLIGMEIPERLSAARIRGGKCAAVIAKKHQAPVGGEEPAPAPARQIVSDVLHLPYDLSRLYVDRPQKTLGGLARHAARSSAIKRLARLPPRGRLRKNGARFPGHRIEQSGGRVVGCGHPI